MNGTENHRVKCNKLTKKGKRRMFSVTCEREPGHASRSKPTRKEDKNKEE